MRKILALLAVLFVTPAVADGLSGPILCSSFGTASGTCAQGNDSRITGAAQTSGTLGQFAATTSAQLAGVLSDETGTGSAVFANGPTLIAPMLGAATATTINKVTVTPPATGSTITIADGKTLTVNNSITFTATDGSTLAIGSGGTLGSAAYIATGTSGGTLCLLNAASCTYSGQGVFNSLSFAGNISANSWTTNGIQFVIPAVTLTDANGSGTIANAYANAIAGPTLTSTSVATDTDAATLFVGAPTCTGNLTCTNIDALKVGGQLNMNAQGIRAVLSIASNSGTSFQLLNGTPTATTPNILTNRGSSNTGLGGASGQIDIIASGADNMRFTSTQQIFETLPTTGTNADTLCMSAGGVILIQAAACTISSLRFKQNVKPWTGDALAELSKFEIATFNIKGQEKNRDKNASRVQIGLIAENIAKAEPECAIYEQDLKTPKSYRQECVIAMLVRSVQQLAAANDNLKSEIAYLKHRRR